jgi:hypothetical protein
MKTLSNFVLTLALGIPKLSIAMDCNGAKLQKWMNDCDSVPGASILKCESRACHAALHYLVEEETIECYTSLKFGPASDLKKYKVLDDFCHGEGPDPDDFKAPTPTPPTTFPPSEVMPSIVPSTTSGSTLQPISTPGPSPPPSTPSESTLLTPSIDAPKFSEVIVDGSQTSSASMEAEEILAEISDENDVSTDSNNSETITPTSSGIASTHVTIHVLATVVVVTISLVSSC